MPAKLDLGKIPKFGDGEAAELNFAGEKLKGLPPEELKAIYDGLHAPIDSDQFNKTVSGVLDLIVNAPEEELTNYINRAFDTSYASYMFMDSQAKTYLFTAFFFNHLRKDGRKFTVGQIDLQTLAVT